MRLCGYYRKHDSEKSSVVLLTPPLVRVNWPHFPRYEIQMNREQGLKLSVIKSAELVINEVSPMLADLWAARPLMRVTVINTLCRTMAARGYDAALIEKIRVQITQAHVTTRNWNPPKSIGPSAMHDYALSILESSDRERPSFTQALQEVEDAVREGRPIVVPAHRTLNGIARLIEISEKDLTEI